MNVLELNVAHGSGPQPEPFLDFLVDGRSLGHWFGGDTTALTVTDHEFRTTNLRRLLGEDIALPTFEPRFYRTRIERALGMRGTPYAPYESAFADGRIGLYYCYCGDMDCGVLSTRIEFAPDTVTWHDVAWQVTYEPFGARAQDESAATFIFDRAPYLALLGRTVVADWSDGVPDLSQA